MRKRSEVKPDVEEVEETGHVTGEPVPPISFDSANEATEIPIGEAFSTIIDTIFVDDPAGVYQKLENALTVGVNRSEHGFLQEALDNAESNARLAHRLWTTASLERQRWELENEVVFAAMRRTANEVLERERAQKVRSKTITESDVDSMCAALYPDEYRAQELRRGKVKAMEESMRNLADLWKSRCGSLQTMLSKLR